MDLFEANNKFTGSSITILFHLKNFHAYNRIAYAMYKIVLVLSYYHSYIESYH